jgi:hypothetical protein
MTLSERSEKPLTTRVISLAPGNSSSGIDYNKFKFIKLLVLMPPTREAKKIVWRTSGSPEVLSLD